MSVDRKILEVLCTSIKYIGSVFSINEKINDRKFAHPVFPTVYPIGNSPENTVLAE